MASLKEKAALAAQEDIGSAFDALHHFGSEEDRLLEIPLDQITTDPTQPRKDLGDVRSLEISIQEHGLLQPILVSPLDTKHYRLIAGERRFTAIKALGYATIQALVRTVEDHRRLEVQLVENLQRKDLNALEEAQSYRRLIQEFGLTQEEMGRRLGKTQAAVNQTLRILELPEEVKDDYKTSYNANPAITKSLLLEIAKQKTEEDQVALWEQAKRGELTVKRARQQKAPRTVGKSAVPALMTFRYPIHLEDVVITLAFARPTATLEEVVEALEEALKGEKARLRDTPD